MEEFVAVLTNDSAITWISWNQFEEVLANIIYPNINNYKFIYPKIQDVEEIRFGAVHSKTGECSKYQKYFNINSDILGDCFLFRLEGETPRGFDMYYVNLLDTIFNPTSLLNIKKQGYVLLSPISREFRILPDDISLEDYKKYYLKTPIELQLKRLSQRLRFQTSLWIDKEKQQKALNGSDNYNIYASDLVSHQSLKFTKIYGPAILSLRSLDKDLISKNTYFDIESLGILCVKLKNLERFPQSENPEFIR